MTYNDFIGEYIMYHGKEEQFFVDFYNKWSESGCINMYDAFPIVFQREIFKAYAADALHEIGLSIIEISKSGDSPEISDTYFLNVLSHHDYKKTEQLMLSNTFINKISRVEEIDTDWVHLFTLTLFADIGIIDKIENTFTSNILKAKLTRVLYEAYINAVEDKDTITVYDLVINRKDFAEHAFSVIDKINRDKWSFVRQMMK